MHDALESVDDRWESSSVGGFHFYKTPSTVVNMDTAEI